MTDAMSNVRFAWRAVEPHEAEVVHAVHLEALAGMAPGLVRPDTLAHFIAHTGRDGITLGGFVESAGMVAYGVLGISSATAAHMAQVIGVAEADRRRFGILDGAASLPAWRGHRLHRELINARLTHAAQAQRTLLGATVAPGNIPSLRGLLDAGFVVGKFAMLYGGLPRLVLHHDLSLPVPRWTLLHKVALTDIDGHESAVKEGLTGFSCSEDANGNWFVHYGMHD